MLVNTLPIFIFSDMNARRINLSQMGISNILAKQGFHPEQVQVLPQPRMPLLTPYVSATASSSNTTGLLFGVPVGGPSSSSGSPHRPKPAKRNGARQTGATMEHRRSLL